MSKNQMTQGISQQYVTSCLSASISSAKLGDVPALLFQYYTLPPCSPSNSIPLVRFRTHERCTGPRRIRVCIDRGLVSRIPRLAGRRQAPHRWLKNTQPRSEGLGHNQGTLCPLTASQCPALSRAVVPSGQEVCVSQDGPYCQGSGLEIGSRKVGRSLARVPPSL